MRHQLILALLICSSLAACAAPPHNKKPRPIERPAVAPEILTFSGRAPGVAHDAEDPIAEASRIRELEHRLQVTGACPKGYTIKSRRVIVQLGERDQFDYEIQCQM